MNFSKRNPIYGRVSLILLLLFSPCVYAFEQTRMNSGMATEKQNAFPVPFSDRYARAGIRRAGCRSR